MYGPFLVNAATFFRALNDALTQAGANLSRFPAVTDDSNGAARTSETLEADIVIVGAGGVHGGNRIGGNAVADIVVFGKIAAESAVAWCDRQGS